MDEPAKRPPRFEYATELLATILLGLATVSSAWSIVFFASVLLFAGISTRMHTPSLRIALLVLALVFQSGAGIFLLRLPVTIAV